MYIHICILYIYILDMYAFYNPLTKRKDMGRRNVMKTYIHTHDYTSILN